MVCLIVLIVEKIYEMVGTCRQTRVNHIIDYASLVLIKGDNVVIVEFNDNGQVVFVGGVCKAREFKKGIGGLV